MSVPTCLTQILAAVIAEPGSDSATISRTVTLATPTLLLDFSRSSFPLQFSLHQVTADTRPHSRFGIKNFPVTNTPEHMLTCIALLSLLRHYFPGLYIIPVAISQPTSAKIRVPACLCTCLILFNLLENCLSAIVSTTLRPKHGLSRWSLVYQYPGD